VKVVSVRVTSAAPGGRLVIVTAAMPVPTSDEDVEVGLVVISLPESEVELATAVDEMPLLSDDERVVDMIPPASDVDEIVDVVSPVSVVEEMKPPVSDVEEPASIEPSPVEVA
jgi:hypothetical protein